MLEFVGGNRLVREPAEVRGATVAELQGNTGAAGEVGTPFLGDRG
jgi:hypothetical protein